MSQNSLNPKPQSLKQQPRKEFRRVATVGNSLCSGLLLLEEHVKEKQCDEVGVSQMYREFWLILRAVSLQSSCTKFKGLCPGVLVFQRLFEGDTCLTNSLRSTLGSADVLT